MDVRWLKKRGYLRPGISGTLSWSWRGEQTGIIGFRMEQDRMGLNYKHKKNGGEWEPVEQTITFYQTPCNYGGHRKWFICPHCWLRVAILYGVGKYFFCRHCHDLTYGSQQEDWPDRLMRKARKIRERLGVSRDLSVPILFKPKNMHQDTFDRLRKEADFADHLAIVIMGKQLGLIRHDKNGPFL
ncbi:MAG: hypothetical protein A2511_17000 [Deltaproteobacteria bacterium RIFOXYD12_FULL_50_9]|nr:MAG: hypothetical protein A2511_17000 [Deltaproteobacteria bacterium RIFOXYD12_FULL_50_9]